MPCWSRGRLALVADAAFCVSLLAGQGSTLAMISAYVLAGELANACGRSCANYQRQATRGERFATAFAPNTRWGLNFRNQVLNVSRLPM